MWNIEDYQLINDLVSLQKSKTILMNNNGLGGISKNDWITILTNVSNVYRVNNTT